MTGGIWIWKREVFIGFFMAMRETFFFMDLCLMLLNCFALFLCYSSNFLIMSIFMPRIKVISLKQSLHLTSKTIIIAILDSILVLISTQVISFGLYLALLGKKGRLIKLVWEKCFKYFSRRVQHWRIWMYHFGASFITQYRSMLFIHPQLSGRSI